MALPKRRQSKSRGRQRRSHWTLKPTGLMTCPHCGQAKLPHTVCVHCGQYKGRAVYTPREAGQ